MIVKYISTYMIQSFHSNLYAMKSCHVIISVKMELVSKVLEYFSLPPPFPSSGIGVNFNSLKCRQRQSLKHWIPTQIFTQPDKTSIAHFNFIKTLNTTLTISTGFNQNVCVHEFITCCENNFREMPIYSSSHILPSQKVLERSLQGPTN